MKYMITFEKYEPNWDYILYMEDDKENWIRVDNATREKLIQLIKGDIEEFVPRWSNRVFTARLGEQGKRKIEKIVTFTTDEGIEDFITVKKILNKLT